MESRILIVDFTDYENYPIGGYLTFAKNLMDSFGSLLALVGITTSRHDPLGRWFKKSINGVEYDFFAIARYNKALTRNVIPDRLVNFLFVKYYKRRILGIGINNIFVQRHESMIALSGPEMNICYSFAGLDNPLSISKYSYAGLVAKWFERKFFRKIGYAGTILARGDDDAIRDMLSRSNGTMINHTIIKFPTRIRTAIFKPMDRNVVRAGLDLPQEGTYVITTGRLAWLKGWKFMVDSFALFIEQIPDARFIMVGEGEDHDKIVTYVSERNLTDKVSLVGKKDREEIALYLNACDLYIMGSYKEGWPTALMEAVACGLPACATEFSSVGDIILEGINGFIDRERNESVFAAKMVKALEFERPVRNEHVTRFSAENLREDLLGYWKLT